MDPYTLYPAETHNTLAEGRDQSLPQCPASTPLLCGSRTLGRGLCVAEEAECNRRTSEKRNVLKQEEDAAGAAFAYDPKDLGRGCYIPTSNLHVDFHKEYDEFDVIPEGFSLTTYNMWGLAKDDALKKLFRLRMPTLLKTFAAAASDCMCLQEISEFAYGELRPYLESFPFISEPNYTTRAERGREVDVFYMSKYRPKRLTIYGIRGVLGYTNCFMVVEYPNLVIFNVYSQAGSVGSVGQEKVWIHYSRCRYDIMNIIYDMILHKYKKNNVILTGDFNFHLDGTLREWPETEMLRKLETIGFIDTWRSKHQGPGYTENTDENYMRWNHKFMEKKYRFDAIIYKPIRAAWKISSSQVFGKMLKLLNPADSDWFVKTITRIKNWNNPGPKGEQLRGKEISAGGTKRIHINASDHYGVRTIFGNRSQQTRRQRRSRSRSTRSV